MDTSTEYELTVRQAARRVGRAEETVRRWIWSGKLPARKLGNVYYVRATDLDTVSSGGQIPKPREESAPLTMHEWLDRVARWKATIPGPKQSTASDLLLEDRAARDERDSRR